MSDSNELEIEISSAEAASAVVFVRGDVDMANAHEVSAVVSVVAGWSETSCVVVDLSAVSFMDSSGIAALMSCHRDLHAAGVGFEVVGARGAPLQVLELTGVLDYLSPGQGGATTTDDPDQREPNRTHTTNRMPDARQLLLPPHAEFGPSILVRSVGALVGSPPASSVAISSAVAPSTAFAAGSFSLAGWTSAL